MSWNIICILWVSLCSTLENGENCMKSSFMLCTAWLMLDDKFKEGFGGETWRKVTAGRPEHRCEDNIKIRIGMKRHGLEWSDLGQGQVIVSGEHGRQLSDYIKCGQFLYCLRNHSINFSRLLLVVWKMESLKSPSTTGLVADFYCGITFYVSRCLLGGRIYTSVMELLFEKFNSWSVRTYTGGGTVIKCMAGKH
jgi:hypothetical protein